MATIGAQSLTLNDLARRTEDKKIAKIIEILEETNEVLEDMMFMEGNLATGHKTTIRSGLPDVAWRLLNYGVQPSKSRTVQVTDTCGMLEAFSKVDKALADLNGNTAAFRLSEDKAFLEAMSQELASVLFYGDVSQTPEKFHGLAPRYSSLSAENGENILDAGGVGADNTSIWMVSWGDDTCHGIYPRGSKAGLHHQDLGVDTVQDAQGGEYLAYKSHYKWDAGFTLKDWRYTTRIANISVGNLTKDASAGADLVDLMVQAVENLPSISRGRPVFYCNKTVRSFLRRQITNATNVRLSLEEVAGKKVMAVDGIPVKRCDAILNTEAQVV